MAEFHAGDDAVPHFGDFVGQNVVVVLVLLDVPVQPQRIQEAVACAFWIPISLAMLVTETTLCSTRYSKSCKPFSNV